MIVRQVRDHTCLAVVLVSKGQQLKLVKFKGFVRRAELFSNVLDLNFTGIEPGKLELLS